MPTHHTWFLATISMFGAALLLPDVSVLHFIPALQLAVVFSGLNLLLPAFLRYAGAPLNALTLILFGLVVNGAMIFWTSVIMPGFYVTGFGPALMFASVLAGVNAFLLLRPARLRLAALAYLSRIRALGRFIPRRV